MPVVELWWWPLALVPALELLLLLLLLFSLDPCAVIEGNPLSLLERIVQLLE